ncbi:MAG: hypothetical protein Q9227_005438 [Pyrenula ochraceoflavens]
MESITASNALHEQSTAILKALIPQSYSDLVALGIFSIGYLTYTLRGIAWDKPDRYHQKWFERPQLQDRKVLDVCKETRNIATKLKNASKDLLIFWGSQSGTAEAFGRQLARECQSRFRLNTLVADLSDYEPDTIAQIPSDKIVILVLSTYGEGDPSDNAGSFWNWTQAKSDVPLSQLRYAAFGLGNSNYKYYNRVVDVVVEGLDSRGADRFLPVGKADDAHGATKEDFLAWKDSLFSHFRQELRLVESSITYAPAITVTYDTASKSHDTQPNDIKAHFDQLSAVPGSFAKILPVRYTRELVRSPARNCLHMELDISAHQDLRYKTGDHLAVYPINPQVEVDQMLRLLDLSERKNTNISIKSLEDGIKMNVPNPCSINTILGSYLDICAAVPRDTVLALAQFAPSTKAKDFLINIGRDKDTWTDFTSRNYVTLSRLLERASSGLIWSDLPLSFLLETLPLIQPRYYSISSSSIISPRTPSITVLVSNTLVPNCPLGTTIPGLASNHLLRLSKTQALSEPLCLAQSSSSPSQSSTCVLVSIRRSKFKPPTSPSTSLIMVAAGTGLAPFRAFILERVRLHALGKPIGRMILFFGCRSPEEDWLYREEMEEAEKKLEGRLEIVVAFSRWDGGEGERGYVQDQVKRRGREVSEMLVEGGCSLYVCGRAGMAREVGEVVGTAVAEKMGWQEGNNGEVERRVKEWREGMRRKGKWMEDVWG